MKQLTETMTYKEEAWDLDHLFKNITDPKVYDAAIAQIEQDTKTFENKKELLSEDISEDNFLELFQLYEKIIIPLAKIGSYAGLWSTENTQASEPRAMSNKVEQFGAQISNRLLFFTLWWRGLSEKTAERLMNVAGKDKYFFAKDRLFKPYTLSEKEEKILTLKDTTGASAVYKLYSLLTGRYLFEFEIDGKKEKITQEALTKYFKHPDPTIRKKAYEVLLKVYGNDAEILGDIYQSLVLDTNIDALHLRNYPSAISVMNKANDLDDNVVDTLLQVCKKNVATFQRFFKLKGKYLKLSKMTRYDVYAPFSAQEESHYTYDQAVTLVLDVFKRFSPEFHAEAKKVVDERHVHAKKTPNKRSGAFCSSTSVDITPYVLINYEGKIRDVSTLAHELGHAVHALLARKQTNFTWHADVPLAETASIFSETLLINELLKTASKEEKIKLLGDRLDDIYASVIRQIYFTLFEIQAHENIPKGATVEELSQLWLAGLKEHFGKDVAVADIFKHEWTRIPHIFETPFYCYGYAFANLLVLALYKQYEEEGESFVPTLIKILSYGGSKRIQDILLEAGIDVSKASFWEQGFRMIDEFIDELEALL